MSAAAREQLVRALRGVAEDTAVVAERGKAEGHAWQAGYLGAALESATNRIKAALALLDEAITDEEG